MEEMVGASCRNYSKALSGKTVLITGATGLVGSHLLAWLSGIGAKAVAFLRDDVPSSLAVTSKDIDRVVRARGDLREYDDLCRVVAEYDPEVVFHLGAQSQVGVGQNYPRGTLEANVRGTWNLLEALRLCGRHLSAIVVASSDKAYGESPHLPYLETHPLAGAYPYDVSKSCVDLISRCYARTYEMPVGIARCGNVYGEGDINFDRIVPGTIRDACRGHRPVLRSDGQSVRDYIYVKDVVSAYLTLAAAVIDRPDLRGEAFNFGYDRPVTVLEIVQRILTLMGQDHLVPDIRNTASGEIRSQYLSSEKARRTLDWSPAYGLDDGLKNTIAWYVPRLEAGVI